VFTIREAPLHTHGETRVHVLRQKHNKCTKTLNHRETHVHALRQKHNQCTKTLNHRETRVHVLRQKHNQCTKSAPPQLVILINITVYQIV